MLHGDLPLFCKLAMCVYVLIVRLETSSALFRECTREYAVLAYMAALYIYLVLMSSLGLPALRYHLQHYIASIYCR